MYAYVCIYVYMYTYVYIYIYIYYKGPDRGRDARGAPASQTNTALRDAVPYYIHVCMYAYIHIYSVC